MDCLKIGCGRFVYGEGVIGQLADEIKRYGDKAFFVGGKTTLPMVMGYADKELQAKGVRSMTHTIDEPNSLDLGRRLAKKAVDEGMEVFVAIGGGRCMDVCKYASDLAKLPMIAVPTSIATCAGASAVCILYTKDEGRYDCSIPKDHEIESVLLDISIIRDSPARLIAAGIMDSLAKLPETQNGISVFSYPEMSLKKYVSYWNSKLIYDFLTKHAVEIYRDPGKDMEKLTDLALINTLVTSMVSGYSSGTGQLALAHGLYDASKRHFPKETKNSYHGEIVALGLRIQMAFNNADAGEMETFEHMMRDMKLPMTLRDIGIGPTDENVDLLVKYCVQTNHMTRRDAQRLAELYEQIR